MRLLVTGGTGFIGSHLAEEGRRRGAEVVVLGLTDRPEEQANAELLSRLGAEVLSGSITDPRLSAAARPEAQPTSSISPWPCERAARVTSSSSRSISMEPVACWRPRAQDGSSASSTAARSAYTDTALLVSPGKIRRWRREISTSAPRSRPSARFATLPRSAASRRWCSVRPTSMARGTIVCSSCSRE